MIATQASSPSSMITSHFQSNTTSSTNNTLASPPRGRRPSISNPMAWLSRTSSAHSHSQSTTSTTGTLRISEPQLVSDLYAPVSGAPYMHPRYGILGAGATVVRTPQDALARAAAAAPPPQDPPGTTEDDGDSSYEDDEPPSPSSPPLPPLPFASKSSPNLPNLGEMRNTPSPTRGPPARAPPPVPILPLFVESTPPQPPFAPVLLAPVPEMLLDPSSLIVTLETSTAALRTTYATLTSRPSHLADYLQDLALSYREREKRKFRDTLVEEEEEYEETYANGDEDDGHRLSSPNTPFTSLFNAHLATAGLLPSSPGLIHLFLDRPSAPYAHILAYLRTPVEHPSLPRLVMLQDRVEDLLELRDEAKYLGLEELHRLCCDIIRRRQGHVRGASSAGSTGSGQIPNERGREAQVRLRTVVRRRPSPSNNTQARGSTGSVSVAPSEVGYVEGPPTSPTASVSARAKSPAARSRSRGTPRSASDWI